jgi:hypothetical protein
MIFRLAIDDSETTQNMPFLRSSHHLFCASPINMTLLPELKPLMSTPIKNYALVIMIGNVRGDLIQIGARRVTGFGILYGSKPNLRNPCHR